MNESLWLLIGVAIGVVLTAGVLVPALRLARSDREYFSREAREWRDAFFEMSKIARNSP